MGITHFCLDICNFFPSLTQCLFIIFSLGTTNDQKMLQQTWYHGEEKWGILGCHCPGCSSCHGIYSDWANARISIPCGVWHLCRTDLPLVPAALKPALYSNSRLVTTHLDVASLAPSLKKTSCETFPNGQTRILCAIWKVWNRGSKDSSTESSVIIVIHFITQKTCYICGRSFSP